MKKHVFSLTIVLLTLAALQLTVLAQGTQSTQAADQKKEVAAPVPAEKIAPAQETQSVPQVTKEAAPAEATTAPKATLSGKKAHLTTKKHVRHSAEMKATTGSKKIKAEKVDDAPKPEQHN